MCSQEAERRGAFTRRCTRREGGKELLQLVSGRALKNGKQEDEKGKLRRKGGEREASRTYELPRRGAPQDHRKYK